MGLTTGIRLVNALTQLGGAGVLHIQPLRAVFAGELGQGRAIAVVAQPQREAVAVVDLPEGFLDAEAKREDEER